MNATSSRRVRSLAEKDRAARFLVRAQQAQGRGDLPLARELFRITAERAQQISEGSRSSLWMQAMCGWGVVHRLQGHFLQAEVLLRQALARADTETHESDLDIVLVCNELAVILEYSGKSDEAAALRLRMQRLLDFEHCHSKIICHITGGLTDVRGDCAAEAAPADRAATKSP
ncbi:tetratricopeptide repeat protein [Streptomyces sp. NBC_00233]|uniref:tetratricopeptide repeat protein n=1 Tax=Streptomyces sp. NBC_00233 TaxID=2975686 RepID=UPI0022594C7C|nr:tetratricopeptide repeat protein [Streptomyces sp. NBC_00233]MCX5233299.1 tetratricopeptide repeat protein [Streptomyces sp. NBC_00233]